MIVLLLILYVCILLVWVIVCVVAFLSVARLRFLLHACRLQVRFAFAFLFVCVCLYACLGLIVYGFAVVCCNVAFHIIRVRILHVFFPVLFCFAL